MDNNYNDGHVQTGFFESTREELEARAKDYSEGNEYLEKALLTLWDNNIKTAFCCAGHENEESTGLFFNEDGIAVRGKVEPTTFIGIVIDENSKDKIKPLIDMLFNKFNRQLIMDIYENTEVLNPVLTIRANIEIRDELYEFHLDSMNYVNGELM